MSPARLLRRSAALVLLAASGIATAAPAAPARVDVKSGHDHPLVQRFAGSWLVGARTVEWDQTAFPSSATLTADEKLASPVVVEGRVTRLFYLAPKFKSPLEVFRNYEQALTAAGFKRRFACETDCGPLMFAMRKTINPGSGIAWANGSLEGTGGNSYTLDETMMAPEQGRLWYGTLPRGGTEVHVLVYTSIAGFETTNTAETFLQIVEPKAMTTGQVKVDAKVLDQGLKADGKVAIYGLYFDTGRAEVKPESKPQLAEMARLLQGQPALRVYIVGHTDNQGTLESNLVLSQQRAQAVVAALAGEYKVDAKRLAARGVASLAPVANNAAEDGRARNRRVELVVQ